MYTTEVSKIHESKKNNTLLFIMILVILVLCVNGIKILRISFDISHADKKHKDAEIVRKACEKNLLLSMKIEEEDKIVRWCEIDKNTIGIQVIKKIRGVWQEITAYKIADTFENVLKSENLDRFDYITYITETAKSVLIKIGYIKW